MNKPIRLASHGGAGGRGVEGRLRQGGYCDYSTGLVPGYTRIGPIPVKEQLQHEMEIME